MSIFMLTSLFALFGHGWCQNELQQVNVIFRHGDRTPQTFPNTFPNDPNMFSDFAPIGPANLTEQGKKRAFNLGEFLRLRYEKESFEEFYAVHNDERRTADSLNFVLHGLYQRKHNLTGQTVELSYRNSQLFTNDKCVDFLNEYEKVLQLPEVRNKFDKFATYLEELRILCGKKSPLIESDIVVLQSNLDIENRMNLPMKPWMTETLKNGTLKQIKLFFASLKLYNRKLARLFTGPLLREITDNLQRKERKMYLYSCHDNNVANFLQVLNLYEPHEPEFGSAIICELVKFKDDFYVKMSYYLGIPSVLKTLKLQDCEQLCPLNKFIDLTKEFSANDEEKKMRNQRQLLSLRYRMINNFPSSCANYNFKN